MKVSDIPIYYPSTMTSLPNWVLWKLESDANGNQSKIPYSALYNGHASSTNAKTWTTFDRVMEVYHNTNEFSGIGFVFTLESGIVFVDIDHCINENGILNETAQDILETVHKDTYVEVSQSGTGLHIFAKGTIPKAFKYHGVEMYSQGRFVAMTGRAIIRKDVTDKSKELLLIHSEYKTPEKEKKGFVPAPIDILFHADDARIVEKALSGSSGFRQLYYGDISGYDSHSNADLRLCMILAFWSDRDRETIDRIFRTSGLCREKWTEREDYRERTITKACDDLEESVSQFIERKRKERTNHFEEYFLHQWGNS